MSTNKNTKPLNLEVLMKTPSPDIEDTTFYCGVEQETNTPGPEHNYWLPSGSQIQSCYNGGGEYSTELASSLIPVSENPNYDTAKELYKVSIADAAHLINQEISKGEKGNIFIDNVHYNFTYKGKNSVKKILKALGPSFDFLFGRTENITTYLPDKAYYSDANRFEIASNYLETAESFIAANAFAIAALTALSKKEIELRDLVYSISDSYKIERPYNSSKDRIAIDYNSIKKGNNVNEYGRETDILTNKGWKTIQEILTTQTEILKPFIIKYCSEESYNTLNEIVTGKKLNALDTDILIEEGELKQNTNEYTFNKKILKKMFNMTTKELEKTYTPKGLSKKIIEVEQTLEKSEIYVKRLEWFNLTSIEGEIDANEINELNSLKSFFDSNPNILRKIVRQYTPSQRSKIYTKIEELKDTQESIEKINTAMTSIKKKYYY